MSIQSAIRDGFIAVASSVRSVRSLVTGSSTGDLSALVTKNKTSVVAAINELMTDKSIGFKYSFALTSQPRYTWIQPTSLTQIYNNAATHLTLNNGTFTFAVPNIMRHWLFVMEFAATAAEGIGIGAEIRVGGVSMARAVTQGPTGMGLASSIVVPLTFRVQGGEAITFHGIHNNNLLGLLNVTSNVQGRISGIAL